MATGDPMCPHCGGYVTGPHACINADRYFYRAPQPEPVDWPSVAREAAARIFAQYDPGKFKPRDGRYPGDAESRASWCCSAALALVAEMKKRPEFGGAA